MHRQLNGHHTEMKLNPSASTRSISRVVPVLLLTGFNSVAQVASDSPVTELAPITVSAHGGNSIPYDMTGVSVTVLDLDELMQEGIYTLSDSLTTVPGAAVLPNGGLNGKGNVSNIVIRGMARQTYVLPMMDGMLISGSNGNGNLTPNILGRSNTFDIGNVELMRGTQGAVYGGGAVAGVLFMETPKGEGKNSTKLFQEAGSHDSYTANLRSQGQCAELHYFVSSTYEHTDNNIRTATGDIPSDSKAGRYECYSQSLRLDYDLTEKTSFTTTFRREDAWYDYASCSGGLWSCIPYRFRSNLVTVRAESQLSRLYTSSIMAGYYGADNMLGHGNNYDLRNVQIEWRNAMNWNKTQSTHLSFRWTRSQYDSTSWAAGNTLENMYSLSVEHICKPVKEWTNSLAVRMDYSSIYHALPTMRAASSYTFSKTDSRIFGSFGRGYRGPGSFERSSNVYHSPWGIYHGSPDLDCETSWSFDMGIEQSLADNQTITVTYFWQQLKDAIDCTSDDWYHYYYTNAPGHWTSHGVELALHGEFGDAWDTGYRLSYTYTQPENENGEAIPNSSRQVWSADIHTSPIQDLTTGVGLTAAAGRRDWNSTRLDSYYTLRWYIEYKVNENLTLHTRVENLTNQKMVTDSSSGNILSPGTSIYGGCTYSF